MFDFSRTFRGVNTDFFFNFSDIFLISPTSDLSDFLLNRAVRAVVQKNPTKYEVQGMFSYDRLRWNMLFKTEGIGNFLEMFVVEWRHAFCHINLSSIIYFLCIFT